MAGDINFDTLSSEHWLIRNEDINLSDIYTKNDEFRKRLLRLRNSATAVAHSKPPRLMRFWLMVDTFFFQSDSSSLHAEWRKPHGIKHYSPWHLSKKAAFTELELTTEIGICDFWKGEIH